MIDRWKETKKKIKRMKKTIIYTKEIWIWIQRKKTKKDKTMASFAKKWWSNLHTKEKEANKKLHKVWWPLWWRRQQKFDLITIYFSITIPIFVVFNLLNNNYYYCITSVVCSVPVSRIDLIWWIACNSLTFHYDDDEKNTFPGFKLSGFQ